MPESVTRTRLIIPAFGGIYDSLANLAYPFLRFCFGLFFVPHGWGKLFAGGAAKYDASGNLVGGTAAGMAKNGIPFPEFMAYYIGALEVFGGLMIAVGLLTRFVAIQIVGFMFVAAFVVHKSSWFWTQRGMEVPLILMVIAIVICIRGGGHLSVDNRLPKEF